MSADKWSKEEDRKLLLLVNDYRSESGKTIMWKDVPMGRFFRSVSATQNRWNMFMKHKVKFKDGQYVLPELNLFDKPEKPLALPRRLRTPKKTTKTYLWGLYTVTHEQ